MPINFIEQVSSYASDIDGVIIIVAALVLPWLVACEFLLFYFVIRFRAKDGRKADYLDGSNPKHKRWITIPHALVLVCDIFIIIAAVRVWVDVKQTLPEPDATVRIVSQQWAWTFQHPGTDGKLDTDDDVSTVEELHVVQGKTYHFDLMSRDVMHSFSVPVFRLKQDAVPGRIIKGWFKAEKLGTYDIQCAEMCGIGHGVMYARIVIETEARHKMWLADHAAK